MRIKGKEDIELAKGFPFKIYKTNGNKDNDVVPHYHSCLEINYIISGTGINIVEDVVYEMKSGEIYVINNYEHHMAYAHGEYEMIVIYFEPELVWNQDSFNYKYLNPFFTRSEDFSNRIDRENGKKISRLIRKIYCEWEEKDEAYQLIVKAYLMEMLALMNRHYKSDKINHKESAKYNLYGQVHEVIQYIHQNIQNKLSLEELAKIACMNKTYLSTYFKKATGNNLSSSIESVRINKAIQLLKTTDMSITDICFEVGFNNTTHFSRVFKQHTGVSAREFRKSL